MNVQLQGARLSQARELSEIKPGEVVYFKSPTGGAAHDYWMKVEADPGVISGKYAVVNLRTGELRVLSLKYETTLHNATVQVDETPVPILRSTLNVQA